MRLYERANSFVTVEYAEYIGFGSAVSMVNARINKLHTFGQKFLSAYLMAYLCIYAIT